VQSADCWAANTVILGRFERAARDEEQYARCPMLKK
jgi:hypothetical protein